MEVKHIEDSYRRYMHIYDYVFGRIFQHGRDRAVKIVNEEANQNARILELGVGTGLSLPDYRKDLNVIGIDISEHMLIKAQEKIQEQSLQNKQALARMSAEELAFPNHYFDYVVVMYVVSVVPDIHKLLNEVARVCKPEGDIIVVNHFQSEGAISSRMEKLFSPLSKVLGWNPSFTIDPVLYYHRFQLLHRERVNLFGYWQLLHFKNKISTVP